MLALSREPMGEWFTFDAMTVPDPMGTGLCRANPSDELGALGAVAQTLVIEARDHR